MTKKFPKLPEWETGDRKPTLLQLETFAQTTHTPVGFLLLEEPPVIEIPIPDYRTIGDAGVHEPSPDLLDTVFICQQRQEWYHNYAIANGEEPLAFIGSLSVDTPIEEATAAMQAVLNFGVGERGSTSDTAFSRLYERAEGLGALVMVNGVVGNNTHRKLDPDEFRGFALADAYAPLIFINGADTKAAQIFTLVHELAHLWIGETALSDASPMLTSDNDVERWCNRVAAEFLVPLNVLREAVGPVDVGAENLDRLARQFKASTLVVVRRIYDAGLLTRPAYNAAYAAERQRVLALMQQRTGPSSGNFYNTQPVRASKRFTRALMSNTLEGQTTYREAFHMLGFKKLATFNELAQRLEIV